MTPKEIGEAYNEITHLWLRADFDQNNGIAQHKRALTFAKNRGRALDVGCGCTGRIIDLLIAEGFTPEGVDISTEMLRLAAERHPAVKFNHQDICDWNPSGKYDFISAWDSIWHIPLAQHEPVLEKLVSSLNPDGLLIFSFGPTDTPGEHTSTFMGPRVYYSTLGTNGFLKLLMDLGCKCQHLETDENSNGHTWLVAQKI